MDANTWGNVLTVGFISGIVASFLNQGLGFGRDLFTRWYNSSEMGAYHALQLATILEGYADKCAGFIGYNDNAPHRPDEQFPDWNVTLPELPSYPENIEGWKAIGVSLAARAHDLRNHLIGRQATIHSVIEHNEHDLDYILDQQASAIGLEAWNLARDLRKKNGLDPYEPTWDFASYLERAKLKADETKAQRNEADAKLWAKIGRRSKRKKK